MRATSPVGVALRSATLSDAPSIRELAGAAFAEYDPAAAHTTTRLMREAGAQTWVAERAGAVVGFIIVRRRESEIRIDAIAVAESERGRRVGTLMMRAAERYARARGVTRITLNTAQANLAALDLFLRCGFTITSRTVVRYWRGQPACSLHKRLR